MYLNIMILPFMPGMIISRLYDFGCKINLSIFNVCVSYNIVGGLRYYLYALNFDAVFLLQDLKVYNTI